jgi:hypothetical protein
VTSSSSRSASSSSTAASPFQFAAAVSSDGNLYKAIGEVVESVKQQLGDRRIDFCQLFVTTAHKSNLGHAPAVSLAVCRCWARSSNRHPRSPQSTILSNAQRASPCSLHCTLR